MGAWNRSTHECRLESLRPEMVEAIQKHTEMFNLGPILDNYLMCIETISEKKKKGLFGGGGDKVIVSTIVTPRWLVWAVKEKNGTTALSAQLQELAAVDYADTPGYKIIPDRGVEITGSFTGRVGIDGSQRVSMFIGLGEEPDALKFEKVLKNAIRAAGPKLVS